MSSKKGVILLAILTAILTVLVIGLSIRTYNDYKQDIITNKELAKEKLAMETELSALIDKYENVQALNSVMDNHLIESKKRVVRLLDSIRYNEPKLQLLIYYKKQIDTLKKEKIRLFRINDSLIDENKQIQISLKNTEFALSKSNKEKKDLSKKNSKLNSKLNLLFKESRELVFNNLTAKGYRFKKNRKEIVTEKAKKVESIKVCFTIEHNAYSLKENKTVYFKILNPDKTLIGGFIQKNYNDHIVSYSSKTSTPFKGPQTNHCAFIEVDKKNILPGTYKIELYFNHKLKQTKTFHLK